MFNKLKNLLFEDEEIIEEVIDDDNGYFEKPVETKPQKSKAPVEKVVVEDSYYEEPKPVVKAAPVVEEQPTEVYKPQTTKIQNPKIEKMKVEEVKPVVVETQPVKSQALGIEIDEVKEYKPQQKPEKFVKKTVVKEEKSSGYERKPVISPIFGVSDKDAETMMKTSNFKKIHEVETKDQVISPMYGVAREEEVKAVEEKVNVMPTVEEKVAEENIPVFSLDDILASREEEVSIKPQPSVVEPIKEEKTVVNNRYFSLFDDEDED